MTLRPIGLAATITAAAWMPVAALASQGPGAGLGTAEPITQATAAAMVLFPPVAIVVFAVARLLAPRG